MSVSKPKTPQPPPPDEDRADGAELPSAGPHADERLTDETKTPGTGALPEPGRNDEVDPGAG